MTSTAAASLPHSPAAQLVFVTAVSRLDVLQQHLYASPCLANKRRRLIAHFNASSAAQAFNSTLDGLCRDANASSTWLVWVHQDVMLPADWDAQFLLRLREAQERMPQLAVAGVYGVAGHSGRASRAGHVLDRGHLLREPAALPCAVDSLDELLVAVRADSGLRMDAAMGFDFYATDLVLQAQARGLQAAVLDVYCEHWSDTPLGTSIPQALAERILRNGRAFEAKWSHRFPIQTSWLALHAPGDVERFIATLDQQAP
jgi:hypothetical protein